MEVWLIIDGEKRGPLPDYEVRGMIARGDIDRETKCWQQGMSDWEPVSSLPLFAREFTAVEEKPEPTPVMPPPLPALKPRQTFWMRRFWARWLDLSCYSTLWWMALSVFGADIKAVFANLFLVIFLYLPWVPLESLLLARFGTTPGKWLLGLRVRNDDGSRLDGNQSVSRALRVYFLGIGLGFSVLSPLCQLFSWFHLRAMGKTVWDVRGGHRVDGKKLRWWGISGYLLAGFLALSIQGMILGPHQYEILKEQRDDLPPFLRKVIDEMRPPGKPLTK